MHEEYEGKLSVKTKLGYSIGYLADGLGYNMFYSFFIFFLTDVANLPAYVAGIVTLIAIFWDAITDVLVGFFSDNYRGKCGRRRPFMLAGAIPYGICMFLLFNNMDINVHIKSAYFIIISMLFFTFYTVYCIPYIAMGGELSEDYNERTSIRSYMSFFTYTACIFVTTVPHLLVEFTQKQGGSITDGWRNVGLLFGVMITGSILLSAFFMRKKENFDYLKEEPEKFSNILKSYVLVAKLKPAKILMAFIFLWAFVSSIMSSASMYMMESILGYDAATRATLGMTQSILPLIWLPLITVLSVKLGKKTFLAGAMLLAGTAAVLFRVFIGFPSAPWMIAAFSVVFTFGNTSFWTVAFSMMYDIGELDEFLHQKPHIGAISAIVSFVQKFGAAFALWIIGILLEVGGYDATLAQQTEEAAHMVLNIQMTIPGLVGILGGCIVLLYPLTKNRFEALQLANERKRQGLPYETAEFEKIL